MAGKGLTDVAGICAAYRSGLSYLELRARFGVGDTTITSALRKGIPQDERASLARSHLLAGALKTSERAQSRKIGRGDFEIVRDGETLRVTASGIEFLFDACDEDLLRRHGWQVREDRRMVRLQYRGLEKPRNVYVYHDILGVVATRTWVVDHINRNPADNRRQNLRVCTQAENNKNRGPRIIDHGSEQ